HGTVSPREMMSVWNVTSLSALRLSSAPAARRVPLGRDRPVAPPQSCAKSNSRCSIQSSAYDTVTLQRAQQIRQNRLLFAAAITYRLVDPTEAVRCEDLRSQRRDGWQHTTPHDDERRVRITDSVPCFTVNIN